MLRDDEHWIRAKTQIMSDEVYRERFTGIRLHPQSVSGKRERLIKPDKKVFIDLMSNKTVRRTTRRAKARKPKVIVQTITRKTSSRRPPGLENGEMGGEKETCNFAEDTMEKN